MTKVVGLDQGCFLWGEDLVHTGTLSGGFVDLLDDLGRLVETVTLVDALFAGQAIVRPKEDLVDLHFIRENLLEIGRRKFDEDLDDVRLVLTGYYSGAEDESRCPGGFDRHEKRRSRRIEAVARIRMGRPERYTREGKMRKARTLEGQIKALKRLLNRYADDGPVGIIDRRYRKQRRHRQDPRISVAIEELVRTARYESTKNWQSHIRQLRRELKQFEKPPKMPSDNTLRRMFKLAENGNPLTTGSAASRRSIANIPEASSVLRQALRVGELVVADTYIVDLPVVDPVTQKPFRPQLTLLLDVGSRGVGGWSMTYETDAFGVGVALARCMQPRPMERISEDYPQRSTLPRLFVGTPDVLLVDNGKPFVANYTTTVAAQNGISVEAVRAFTPTDKAIIERMFLTIIALFLQQFANYLGGSVWARGKDPFEGVVMTLDLFEDHFQRFIDEIYHHKVHEGLVYPGTAIKGLSPYQAWTLLVEEYGAPRVSAWQFEWIRMLPFEKRKIHRAGVQMHYLKYGGPDLDELWHLRGTEPDGSFVFHYHPADLRQIYTVDANGILHTLTWRYARNYSPSFGRHTLKKIREMCPAAKTEREIEQALVDFVFDAMMSQEPDLVMIGTKAREQVDLHSVKILKTLGGADDTHTIDLAEPSDSIPVVGGVRRDSSQELVLASAPSAVTPSVEQGPALKPDAIQSADSKPTPPRRRGLSTVDFRTFRSRPELGTRQS
ncbi:Mu transposase-like protein [Frondihabitans sp. PhB188]|uniref:Mu transposase C-terminal domain-containing protein n=1 Tax=Frondihabitans sp. PhB188 TaxID=2485200 RepID=UPI000F4868DD|nr:Mu transposase C-terminal domain-containing protein [Frondihabitans sp. PhB188]ROQ37059.1 Mu transposase-like protein [Frondihabitans sp. PhB188]